MEKIIGYCGIVCSDCPVFVATLKDDEAERKRMAEIFTKQYGEQYKPEDINCVGCTSENPPTFSYCNICEIRKCGTDKKIENCGHCNEYPCEKLSKLFDKYPKAKETLDEKRRELGYI